MAWPASFECAKVLKETAEFSARTHAIADVDRRLPSWCRLRQNERWLTRPLQLTRPSVAALLRGLAAERQSFGRHAGRRGCSFATIVRRCSRAAGLHSLRCESAPAREGTTSCPC